MEDLMILTESGNEPLSRESKHAAAARKGGKEVRQSRMVTYEGRKTAQLEAQ